MKRTWMTMTACACTLFTFAARSQAAGAAGPPNGERAADVRDHIAAGHVDGDDCAAAVPPGRAVGLDLQASERGRERAGRKAGDCGTGDVATDEQLLQQLPGGDTPTGVITAPIAETGAVTGSARPVPEPVSILLMAGGVAAVLYRSRHRTHK
jgi:hypothetical protein